LNAQIEFLLRDSLKRAARMPAPARKSAEPESGPDVA
jgi:hypothetical protein